jgi:peptidoglycan L-alanyl-D-glutamate endopeptidase CwlK
MAKYSTRSEGFLEAADPRLARLFRAVVRYFDNSILNSIRTIEEQIENVRTGLSKTMDSKHLPGPDGKARAVDSAPYPQRWGDNTPSKMTQWEVDQVYYGGFVMGFAAAMGIPLRYGGDWNSDRAQIGTGFRDLDHFELLDKE